MKLSGLIQFCPVLINKLMGAAPSAVQAESGNTALFRALTRAQMTGKISLKLMRRLSGFLPDGHDFTTLFRAAIARDTDAMAALDRMGAWEVMYLWDSGEAPYNRKARIAVERSAMRPHALASEGRFGEAVEHMLADPLLTRYLWDEAVDVFRRITEFDKLKVIQSSLVLETELSALAALDVQLCRDAGTESMFMCLLPGDAMGKLNPVGLLFAWFRTEYGLKSINSILSHPRLLELELAEATLKRWSSGTHCISDETYRAMALALSYEEDLKPVWARLWAARVLNMIGYVGQHYEKHARALAKTPYPRAAAPWPEYPFGYASFAEWSQARYRYWFDFHCEEIERALSVERTTAPRH